VVIHNVGKVISGELVCTLIEYFVIEHRRVDDYVATDDIVDVYLHTGLDKEAYHILMTRGEQCIDLLLGQGE
jgi:hypothetical protein